VLKMAAFSRVDGLDTDAFLHPVPRGPSRGRYRLSSSFKKKALDAGKALAFRGGVWRL
jgi:hypothetical protein